MTGDGFMHLVLRSATGTGIFLEIHATISEIC
jgi:hypothetical protein